MKSTKCPQCGLVMLASASICKRCGSPLEVTGESQVQSDGSDLELVESIKTRKSVIYGVGFMGTLALSIITAVNTEDTTRLMVLFAGIILVGFIGTWVVASMVESRMLAGRADIVCRVTPAQKSSVLTSSLVCAFIVSNSDYGFVIAPLIVVIFNGALYIYDRQMKSKQGANRR